MSETSPYQVLGVSEESSFEEIQAAKQRRLDEVSADELQQEQVEQAYDMILMQRLKLRQEGKIAVPDRIRYAERTLPADGDPLVRPKKPQDPPVWSQWMQRWLDTPSWWDIGLPAAVFVLLWGWAVATSNTQAASSSLPLALGLFACIYFLYRKEHRFLRSVGLSLLGLFAGGGICYGLGILVGSDLSLAGLSGVILAILWIVASYLR